MKVRGWKLEVGNWRLEVRGKRLEVGGCWLFETFVFSLDKIEALSSFI